MSKSFDQGVLAAASLMAGVFDQSGYAAEILFQTGVDLTHADEADFEAFVKMKGDYKNSKRVEAQIKRMERKLAWLDEVDSSK